MTALAEPRPARDQGPRPAIMIAAALVLGVVLAAAWFLALGSTRETAPPVVSPADPRAQLEDLVAAEPGNVEARRRLADLHFAADRFDAALEHYLVVLEAKPRDPVALARSGWIAYEGGDAATAQRLVAESLDVRSRDPEALWYLAQIRLLGLDDPAGAALPLRALLRRDDLADGFRTDVRELLDETRR